MFFDDWEEKSVGLKVSERLLWDCDLSRGDWNAMRVLVVQRVIERGSLNDEYAAIRLYGGIENFKAIIREIPVPSDRNMNFVVTVFHVKKEELKCTMPRTSFSRKMKKIQCLIEKNVSPPHENNPNRPKNLNAKSSRSGGRFKTAHPDLPH